MSKQYSNETNFIDGNNCPYCHQHTGYDYTTSGIPECELYECRNCGEMLVIDSEVTVEISTSKAAKIRLLNNLGNYLKGSILNTKDGKSGREVYVIGSGRDDFRKAQYKQVFETENGRVDLEQAEWLGY